MNGAEAFFDGIGDALRNEVRKVALCPFLKVPMEIDRKLAWAYPHLWCPDRQETTWTASFSAWLLMNNVVFTNNRVGSRCCGEMWEAAEGMGVWIRAQSRPIDKEGWLVPLAAVKRILACVAFAGGGYDEENRTRDAFKKAIDDGFLNVQKILEKKPTPSFEKFQPRGGRGASSHNRWNGRARGGGGRGFFRGRGNTPSTPSTQPTTAPGQ